MKNSKIMLSVLMTSMFVNATAEAESQDKPKIEISGLIELGYEKNRTIGRVKVETIELGVTANLTENLSANLVLLSELDDAGKLPTNDLIDEAVLTGNIKAVGFTIGKLTLPFGAYETAMNSDPAGLDIGETGGAKALLLSTEISGITLLAWRTNRSDNGFSIGYNGDNFAVGVDTIDDALGVDAQTTAIKNKGVAIHGQASFANTTVIIEQIRVEADTAIQKKGQLTQVELNYTMDDWIFAVSQNKGTTTNGTKNDTNTNTYGISYSINEEANITVESKKMKAEKSVISAKLAYQF
ncbi:hypothetical protein [Candidatus Thioglobus sp.]|uniref:hypothetical protein n=1 Tax=Candidatus Thioglobus sp. TaxID=2026721 RepID=UPI003D0BB84F